jgi:hypothetical protein
MMGLGSGDPELVSGDREFRGGEDIIKFNVSQPTGL